MRILLTLLCLFCLGCVHTPGKTSINSQGVPLKKEQKQAVAQEAQPLPLRIKIIVWETNSSEIEVSKLIISDDPEFPLHKFILKAGTKPTTIKVRGGLKPGGDCLDTLREEDFTKEIAFVNKIFVPEVEEKLFNEGRQSQSARIKATIKYVDILPFIFLEITSSHSGVSTLKSENMYLSLPGETSLSTSVLKQIAMNEVLFIAVKKGGNPEAGTVLISVESIQE